jgi:hypothetical protein
MGFNSMTSGRLPGILHTETGQNMELKSGENSRFLRRRTGHLPYDRVTDRRRRRGYGMEILSSVEHDVTVKTTHPVADER